MIETDQCLQYPTHLGYTVVVGDLNLPGLWPLRTVRAQMHCSFDSCVKEREKRFLLSIRIAVIHTQPIDRLFLRNLETVPSILLLLFSILTIRQYNHCSDTLCR